AKEIIDNYKKQFPNIQKYMNDTINFAKENGYVETLMGRKRWLKDINSANFTVRGFAERIAINSPIQGTAADMIKLAMIKIHEAFSKNKFRSKMLLQVHDELVLMPTKMNWKPSNRSSSSACKPRFYYPMKYLPMRRLGRGRTGWRRIREEVV
ncbi:MAG TPA: DNA polymerase, partial [Chitinophagaceae bacterium]|nr:DNA polymerase [Chitinophagaceae bacterium]